MKKYRCYFEWDDSYLNDEHGEIKEFNTEREAQKALDKWKWELIYNALDRVQDMAYVKVRKS